MCFASADRFTTVGCPPPLPSKLFYQCHMAVHEQRMYNNIPPLPKRIQHTIIPRDSTLHEALNVISQPQILTNVAMLEDPRPSRTIDILGKY